MYLVTGNQQSVLYTHVSPIFPGNICPESVGWGDTYNQSAVFYDNPCVSFGICRMEMGSDQGLRQNEGVGGKLCPTYCSGVASVTI